MSTLTALAAERRDLKLARWRRGLKRRAPYYVLQAHGPRLLVAYLDRGTARASWLTTGGLARNALRPVAAQRSASVLDIWRASPVYWRGVQEPEMWAALRGLVDGVPPAGAAILDTDTVHMEGW